MTPLIICKLGSHTFPAVPYTKLWNQTALVSRLFGGFPYPRLHLLVIDGVQTFKDHDLVWLDQLRRILQRVN